MAIDFIDESTAAGRKRAPVADRKHLRVREPDSEQRVTFVELFFDLVYVFAITQISHSLIDDLSAAGVAKAVFLLMVVWWAWIYTTWMANWFDPASVQVRLVLIACMLFSLLMAAALPHAFEQDGALFAVAYTALQVGRNAAGALLLGRQQLRANFERMLTWSVASGVLWIAGGLASEKARPWLWIAALAVDFAAPVAGYRVPRLGRTRTEELPVDGGHFAERFQLFIILSLGEQVVLSGGTAADAGLDVLRVLALTTAFAVTAALWWLYFDEVASNSKKVLTEHEDPGRLARDAFSYLHLPIVAGIIAAAVGAEIIVLHPDEHEHGWPLVVLIAGPLLYLLGEAAFRWRMARKYSAARLSVIAALLLLAVPAGALPALAVGAIQALLIGGLAAYELWARPHATTTAP